MERYLRALEDERLDPKAKIRTMSSGMVAKVKLALTFARDSKPDHARRAAQRHRHHRPRAHAGAHSASTTPPERTLIISSHLVDELEADDRRRRVHAKTAWWRWPAAPQRIRETVRRRHRGDVPAASMGKAVWKAMLKLVKYELRKNRTAILVAAGDRVRRWRPISSSASPRESASDVYVAIALLTLLFALRLAFAVFILGVSSYSGELKRKSSYLIFMTPNSALAVVISKLLFTLALAILFPALALALLAVDMPILSGRLRRVGRLLSCSLSSSFLQQGVCAWRDHHPALVLTAARSCSCSILSYVGVAYLSITHQRHHPATAARGGGCVSFLLFVRHQSMRALPHFRPVCDRNARDVRATGGLLCRPLAPAILQSVLGARRLAPSCSALDAEKTRQPVRVATTTARVSAMETGRFCAQLSAWPRAGP